MIFQIPLLMLVMVRYIINLNTNLIVKRHDGMNLLATCHGFLVLPQFNSKYKKDLWMKHILAALKC